MNTKDFLEAIYADRPGYFTLNYRHNKYLKTKTLSSVDNALKAVKILNDQRKDVWMSLGKTGVAPKPGQRIKIKDVTSIPGLWADIDIAGPGHETDKALPENIDQAMAMIITPQPTIVVSTGGGIHAYWLFDEPWVFEAGDEEPIRVTESWHNMLAQRAALFGWHLDNVSDLARILRVPGTVNHKLEYPRTVEVVSEGPTYPQDYLVGLVDLKPRVDTSKITDADLGWAKETIELHGWTHCQGDKWARPGKDCKEGLSAQVHPWGMYVYTDADDKLPRGWYSPRQVAKAFDVTLTKPADSHHDAAVEKEAERLRVRTEARDLVNREALLLQPLMPPMTVSELAVLAETEDTYRVDSLLPTYGRVILAAAKKTGKTTMTANLVKSLADGEPFLGRFEVLKLTGNLGLVDLEMTPRKLYSWYQDIGIDNLNKVRFMAMRGQANRFNIMDVERRAEIARMLTEQNVQVLVVDPIRPLMAANNLDENLNSDVGKFLDAFDALSGACTVEELVLVHHTGHNAKDRSRGAAAFGDWPDATWAYWKDSDSEDGSSVPRWLRAEGRDVDLPPTEVMFSPQHRSLSLNGEGRLPRDRDLDERILEYLDEHGTQSQSQLKEALGTDFDVLKRRLEWLLTWSYVTEKRGARNARLISLTDPMEHEE